MSFQPTFCPYPACRSHSGAGFTFSLRGRYRRKLDGRLVTRFRCGTCHLGFSEQTFRLDFRLKRPELLPRFFFDRVSKVTHRQSARIHACSRTTEERHFRRLLAHCEAFHDARLAEIRTRGGLGNTFLLDELETFEQHRKLKPVTVPVLIEKASGFVLDVRVGALGPRGNRTPAEQETLERQRQQEGVRRSESSRVVRAAFERLREHAPKEQGLIVLTDRKASYERILKQLFGKRCLHLRTISTKKRDTRNPLWPVNHTLARLRDGLSRLVRRTWAAAKLRRRLAGHLAIWVCYRNYVRGKTNRHTKVTPAMALGAAARQWRVPELLEWRVFHAK